MFEPNELPNESESAELFLFDTHCHLDLAQFAEDRNAVMARAWQAGVRSLVNPGIDLEQSRAGIALAERYSHGPNYPDVYAAVGIHPNSSSGLDQSTLTQLREMATHHAWWR